MIPIVVDIMRDVVAAVEVEAIQKSICTSLRYFHGPVEELESDLLRITAAIGQPGYTGDPKYPCIYLLQDFTEERGTQSGYYANARLPIIAIMAESGANKSSDERYNTTFRPILYPLYELLLKHIARNGNIVGSDPDSYKHQKIDRLFYGRRKFGTTVTDYVDAIELKDLFLTVMQPTSCARKT